jgi:hypothetical protein
MVIIVERSAMEIHSGPVRAIFPQGAMKRGQLSKHDSQRAAALFTASLRQLLRTVPLTHE